MKQFLTLAVVLFFNINFLACSKTPNDTKKLLEEGKKPNAEESIPTTKTLKYSIESQSFSSGTPKDLKLVSGLALPYQEKDQLRFRLTPNLSGYVYLIKESLDLMDKERAIPKYSWVFPPSKTNNFIKAEQENKLPNQDLPALEVGQMKDKEKLWLVWSDKKLMGLEMIKISLDRGDEQEIVKGNELIDIEAAESLKNMLEKYAANKNEKVKLIDDTKNRTTELTTSENIITVAIEMTK